MYCEVTGKQGLVFKRAHHICLPSPLQGKIGDIKLKFYVFVVYLQKYGLKSYETSLNYSSGPFKPNDMILSPPSPFLKAKLKLLVFSNVSS